MHSPFVFHILHSIYFTRFLILCTVFPMQYILRYNGLVHALINYIDAAIDLMFVHFVVVHELVGMNVRNVCLMELDDLDFPISVCV